MDLELFRYTEQCLREYHENLALVKQRRCERNNLPMFSDPSPYRVQGGGISEPVAIQCLRLEDLDAEIARLDGRTAPITLGLETVGQKTIYRPLLARYFEGKGWKEVASELKCSRSRVEKIRLEFVRIFAKLLLNSWRTERTGR